MVLSELAAIAASAVVSVLNQTWGGALEEVGTQIVQFLKKRFKGKLTIEQAKQEPRLLEAAIITEAHNYPDFKNDLEKLVGQLQELRKGQSEVNQNAYDGSVNINSSNNQGQVTGIDQRTQSFRYP